jgi:hypothetical protein
MTDGSTSVRQGDISSESAEPPSAVSGLFFQRVSSAYN